MDNKRFWRLRWGRGDDWRTFAVLRLLKRGGGYSLRELLLPLMKLVRAVEYAFARFFVEYLQRLK